MEYQFRPQKLALEYCKQYGITGEKLTAQITNAFCVGYGFDRTPSPSADKLIAETVEKCAEISVEVYSEDQMSKYDVSEAILNHFNQKESE